MSRAPWRTSENRGFSSFSSQNSSDCFGALGSSGEPPHQQQSLPPVTACQGVSTNTQRFGGSAQYPGDGASYVTDHSGFMNKDAQSTADQECASLALGVSRFSKADNHTLSHWSYNRFDASNASRPGLVSQPPSSFSSHIRTAENRPLPPTSAAYPAHGSVAPQSPTTMYQLGAQDIRRYNSPFQQDASQGATSQQVYAPSVTSSSSNAVQQLLKLLSEGTANELPTRPVDSSDIQRLGNAMSSQPATHVLSGNTLQAENTFSRENHFVNSQISPSRSAAAQVIELLSQLQERPSQQPLHRQQISYPVQSSLEPSPRPPSSRQQQMLEPPLSSLPSEYPRDNFCRGSGNHPDAGPDMAATARRLLASLQHLVPSASGGPPPQQGAPSKDRSFPGQSSFSCVTHAEQPSFSTYGVTRAESPHPYRTTIEGRGINPNALLSSVLQSQSSTTQLQPSSFQTPPPSFPSPHDQAQRQLALTSQIHSILSRLSKDTGSLSDLQTAVRPASSNVDVQPSTAAPLPQTTQATSLSSTTPLSMHYRPPPPPKSASADGPIGADPLASRNRFLGSEKQSSSAPPRWGRQWQRRPQGSDSPSPGRSAPLQMTSMYFSNGTAPPLARGPGVPPGAPLGRASFLGPPRSHQESRFNRGPTAVPPGVSSAPQHRLDREKPRSKISTDRESGPRKRGGSPSIHEAREEEGQERWAVSRDTRSRRWGDHPQTLPCPSSGKPWPGSHVWRSKPSPYQVGGSKEEKAVRRDPPSPSRGFSLRREKHISVTPMSAPPPPSRPYIHRVRSPSLKTTTAHRPRSRPSPSVHRRRRPSSSSSCGFSTSKKPPRGASPIPFSGWDDSKPHRRPSLVQLNVHGAGFPSPGVSHRGPGRSRERGGGPRRLLSGAGSRGSPQYSSRHPSGEASLERDGGRTRREPSSATAQARQKRTARHFSWGPSTATKRTHVTNHKLPLIEDAECQQELALSKKSVLQLLAEGEPLAAAKFVTDLPSPKKCSSTDDPQTDQATTATRIQNKMPSLWVHSSLHYLYDLWKYFHDALSAAGTPRIAERCPPYLLITGLPNVNASALQKALSNHFKALKIPLGKLVIPVYPETGFCVGYCLVEVGTHWPVIAALLRAPQFQWRGVCTQIRPLPCPQFFQLNAYLARVAAQRSKAQGALNVADWTPSQFDACSSVLYPPMMDALTQIMARREQDSENNQIFGLQASPFSVQYPIMAVTSTHRLKLLVPVPSCALSAQLSLWLQPQLLRSTTVPPLSETTSAEDISPSAYFPLYTAPQAAAAALHHISNSSTTQETNFVLPDNAAPAGVTQILPPPFLTQTNATNVLPLMSQTTENAAVGSSEKPTQETTENALPSETVTLPSTPRSSVLHQSAAHQSLSSSEPSVETMDSNALTDTDTNALTETAADATQCCIQASENGVAKVVEKGEPLGSHLPPHVPISTKSDPSNATSENYDHELQLQLQQQQLIEVKDSGVTTDDVCRESDSSQGAFPSAFIDGDSTATVVADGDMDVSQSDDDDDNMTSSLSNVLQRKVSQDQLKASSSTHTDPSSALAQYWLSESSSTAAPEHPDSSSTLFSSLLPAEPLNVTGQVLPTLVPKRAPSTTVSLSRHSPSLEFPVFPSLKVDRENVVVKPVAREEEFGLLSLFQFVHNSFLGLHILLVFADKLALWSQQTQETLKTRPAADTVATWASPFDFETEGLYAHELREDLVALRPILKSLMPNKSLPFFEEAPHVIYLSQIPNRIFQQDQDGIARPLFEALLERLGGDNSCKHALESELWGPQYFRFAETSRYRGDGIVLLPSFCPVSRYGNPFPEDNTPPDEVARRYIIQLPGLYRPIRIHRALYLLQDVERDMDIIAQVVKLWTTILAYHLIAFVAENNETRFSEPGNTGAPGSPMALAEIQAHPKLTTLFEFLPYLKCFASGIRLPIEEDLLDLRAWMSMLPTIDQLLDATKDAADAPDASDPLELLRFEGALGRCNLARSSCSAIHFIETYFFSVEAFFRLPSFAPYLKVFCHGASQQPFAESTENKMLAPVVKRQIRITAHMQQKLQQEICRHTLPNFFLPVQHRALAAYHQAADVAGATEQLFSPITGEPLDETSPITLPDVCCASSVVSKVLDILVRYVEANFPVTASVSPTAESQKRMPQVVQWLMFENEPDWQATARIPSILCASGQPLAGIVGQSGSEGTSPFELTGDIYSSAAEAKLCCALSCLRYFAHLERSLLSTLGVSAKDDLEMLTFVDATKEDITSSEQQPAPYAFGLSSADEDIEEDVASTRTKTVDKIETTWDDIPRNIDESHYRESIPVASLSLSGGLEDIADVSASFEANLWTPEGLCQLQKNSQFRFVPLRYTISTPRHQYLTSRVVQTHCRGQDKQYKWTHHNNLFQPKEEDVIANELQQKGVEKAMLTQQVFNHTAVAHALPVDASPKPTADTKPDPLLSVT